jgi:NAD(P)-dependent dehydrogenase (short-subunit alcohol dehydrogenase family)
LGPPGGASGFGAAIASRYAREGAKVVLGDINVAGGEKVASELPSNMSFLKMDVTKAEDWKATVDFAFARYGRLDILVNNAGTTYRSKVKFALLEPTLLHNFRKIKSLRGL